MKRVALFLFSMGLMGLGIFYLLPEMQTASEPLDLLPGNTVMVAEWESRSHVVAQWKTSPLGKKVREPAFKQMLVQAGVPLPLLEEFLQTAALFDPIVNNPGLQGMPWQKSVLAQLPALRIHGVQASDLFNLLVLIVPLKTGALTSYRFERNLGLGRPKTLSSHQGIELATFALKQGKMLTVAQFRGLLICALSPDPVRRCIDQSLKKMVRTDTGLYLNYEYLDLKSRTDRLADFFVYVDLAALLRHLSFLSKEGTRPFRVVPHHVALFHQRNAHGERLELIAKIRKAYLQRLSQAYELAPPAEDPFDQRLSSSTVLYLWSNWWSPKTLWNLGESFQQTKIDDLLQIGQQKIETLTGKPLSTFFQAFSGGLGVLMKRQEGEHVSEQTLFGIFFKMRNRVLIEQLLARLLGKLPTKTQNVAGKKIVSLVLGGGLVLPSYALADSRLFFADSPELLGEMLKEQAGLVRLGAYQRLRPPGQEGNIFVFAKTGELCGLLERGLEKLLKQPADHIAFLPQRAQETTRQFIIPMLASMKQLGVGTIRATAADEELSLEMDYMPTKEMNSIVTPTL